VTGTRPDARKLVLAIVIPLLVFLSFGAWSFSSPAGASPDDDFHLASIWCGLGEREGLCENREDDPISRYVPAALSSATCYAFDSGASAQCWDEDESGMAKVNRANMDGLYPPVFYGAMSIFASDNVPVSVMAMRLFNAAFASALLTGVFFALPRRLRPALVVSVAVTVVPLGMFVIGSTNPSSWALLSAATVWITLYGALNTTGRRRLVLIALTLFGTVIGAGSRADAAVYAVFAVLLALFLGWRSIRAQFPALLAGVGVVIISLLFYFSAWQGASIVGGLESDRLPLSAAQHISNFLATPSLWMGAFGGWGLGWLDTPMPAAVSVLAGAVFWGAFFVGLHRANVRRGIAVTVAIAAMWLVPVVLLAQSKMLVGEVIQPRYLLPLMIIAVGVASLRVDADHAWRGMRFLLAAAALAFTNTTALHINLQRYTTGLDQLTLDPGSHAEWWWAAAPSPLVIWVGGALAFAGVFAALWFTLPVDRIDQAVIGDDARSSGTPGSHADGSSAAPGTPVAADETVASPAT